MSSELIGILGVGVALLGVLVAMASLLLSGLRGVEKRLGARIDSVERRMDALEKKLEGRMGALEHRMSTLEEKLEGRMDLIDHRLSAVERGLAKLEGLMVGIRDALFGTRRAANS